MISRITSTWRRLVREEDGSAHLTGMVLLTPVLFLLLATAFEVGLFTARATLLERGLDIATRQVRIDTGFTPDHDELKEIICETAGIIPNCTSNLRLEMLPRDLRDWTDVPSHPDCTDAALPVTPMRSFVPGLENELVVLRACAKFEPVFGSTLLTSAIYTDTNNDYGITAISAYVQEPR